MSAGRHPECRERFGTRFERFGGPEAILFPNIVYRSVCHPHSHTAIRYHCVLLQSRVAIGFGAVGGAGSHRVIGLFFAPFPLSLSWVLGGPRGKFHHHCRTDSDITEIWRDLAKVSDDATSRSDPTSHARIPRMTVVATQLPQIRILQYYKIMIL